MSEPETRDLHAIAADLEVLQRTTAADFAGHTEFHRLSPWQRLAWLPSVAKILSCQLTTDSSLLIYLAPCPKLNAPRAALSRYLPTFHLSLSLLTSFVVSTVTKVENLSKRYRLGVVNRDMLYKDLQSCCAKFRSLEDPTPRIAPCHPFPDPVPL
jgi:hypothetical protein